MARPKKQGLEYFRHYAKIQGKTMDTLQSDYGNDGYAFWFKLLEILAQQEDLFFDCSNVANWRYLVSNAKVKTEVAEEIMSLLCDFEAIDSQLWKEKRIIWAQKLVDNAEEVYEKRKIAVPKKPSFRDGNDSTPNIPVTETQADDDIADISDTESTQSKVKESKENIYYTQSAGAREDFQLYTIFDILKICKTECPVIYNRHHNKPNADYLLGQILDELHQSMTLDEIKELLKKANKTYIVQPKYKTLDLIWALNNSQKVLNSEIIDEQTSNSQYQSPPKKPGIFDVLNEVFADE